MQNCFKVLFEGLHKHFCFRQIWFDCFKSHQIDCRRLGRRIDYLKNQWRRSLRNRRIYHHHHHHHPCVDRILFPRVIQEVVVDLYVKKSDIILIHHRTRMQRFNWYGRRVVGAISGISRYSVSIKTFVCRIHFSGRRRWYIVVYSFRRLA